MTWAASVFRRRVDDIRQQGCNTDDAPTFLCGNATPCRRSLDRVALART